MKKILIIDDDSCKVEKIQGYIRKIGEFETIVAESQSQAMRNLIKNPNAFDYIILDMCFPEDRFGFPEKDKGVEFMEFLYGVDSYAKLVTDTKIIVCSSEPRDSYDFDSVVGIIKYDCFVYLLPQFEKYLI